MKSVKDIIFFKNSDSDYIGNIKYKFLTNDYSIWYIANKIKSYTKLIYMLEYKF